MSMRDPTNYVHAHTCHLGSGGIPSKHGILQRVGGVGVPVQMLPSPEVGLRLAVRSLSFRVKRRRVKPKQME